MVNAFYNDFRYCYKWWNWYDYELFTFALFFGHIWRCFFCSHGNGRFYGRLFGWIEKFSGGSTDPELVKDILENELLHKEVRDKKRVQFWQDLGAYGPAWGMLGTLLGLINMMKSMGSNVDTIGSGMSLALITTLYGSMLANWICIPIGRKLEKCNNEELLIMEVVTEGVLSIQAGENTRIIREKIRSVIEMETKEEDNA